MSIDSQVTQEWVCLCLAGYRIWRSRVQYLSGPWAPRHDRQTTRKDLQTSVLGGTCSYIRAAQEDRHSLLQEDHRASAVSLGWGQLMSFQAPRHCKGLAPTLTFPAPRPRHLSGRRRQRSQGGCERRSPEGSRTSGSQRTRITAQGGRREEGYHEPRLQPLCLLHCPMRLHLQNSNFKVSLF